MFDSILQGGAVARTRALGGTVSVALHGAIVAAVIWAGSRAVAPPSPAISAPVLLFRAAASSRPMATVAAPAALSHPKPHHAPPRHLAVPREVPKQPPPEAPPQPTSEPTDEPNSEPSSDTDGAPSGPAALGSGPMSGTPGAGTSEEPTYLLGEGMTLPRVQAEVSAPFRWTRAQMDAHVSGRCLAQCTLTSAGTLRDCRLLTRVPGIDDAQVMEYLAGLRFSPALQGGRPISIRSYTVPLRLQVP